MNSGSSSQVSVPALAPAQHKVCVCGNGTLLDFSPGYLHCPECETLIARRDFDASISQVDDDASHLYGSDYWYSHMKEMGYPDIETRAWLDMPERCAHWMATVWKYKRPPGKFLEIGCAHGGLVALAEWAGFEATGLELSAKVAELAMRTFSVRVLIGPLEQQQLAPRSFDVIALMDVLEHLPYPRSTMRLCLDLLKDDGILIIQTPRYVEGRSYASMVADNDSFLIQLKANEHLHLFSARSLERMFVELGVAEVRQENAIFWHYDQFVVIGKTKLEVKLDPVPSDAAKPAQRLVRALIDARLSFEQSEAIAEKNRSELTGKLAASEADRQDRLNLINEQAEKIALYDRTVNGWSSTPWGRLLRLLGVPLTLPALPAPSSLGWLQRPRSFKTYTLPGFRAEYVNSRPDLHGVRDYNRQMIDTLFKLQDLSGKALLDIGASPHGYALERALERGVNQYCGVGLGVSADILLHDGSRTAVLLNMNADRLELASESFDAIISLSTFEHFFHPETVLAEMHRVLKRGGVILTHFQPIWTSACGHHLHHIPDVCKLVPAWAHLKWTKEEMLENLGSTWPATASMSLDEVIRWIYDSSEMNRLSASTLRRALETSPLSVTWITPQKDDISETELREAHTIATTLPYSVEELTTRGFSALLKKTA